MLEPTKGVNDVLDRAGYVNGRRRIRYGTQRRGLTAVWVTAASGCTTGSSHGTGDHPKEAVGGIGDLNSQIVDEMMATGAAITGRGTSDAPNGWGGDHHDGVPIYVLSRNPAPAWAAKWPAVHYVRDLEAAVRDAKHAAVDENVLVHGASITVQRAFAAGLLDGLEIHLIPVLLGDGGACSSTSASNSASWSESEFS
jgi:dihydrofolate reductase